jgi:hypothetical protein
MKNYFSNVRVQHKGLGDFPIRWENWSPECIYFKSNSLTKKLLPSENIVSYKSKGDRDRQMAELTGGKLINSGQFSYHSNENYKAVHVQMKDLKSEYATANVDFIDQTGRKDSVGNCKGSLDVLCYISSRHHPFQWHRDPSTGKYTKQYNANPCPLNEGYNIAYGGQGEDNGMSINEWDEWLDIVKGIRQFLFEVVVPFKRGDFDTSELMVA